MNKYDNHNILSITKINIEKGYVILRFLSKKTSAGRVADPPFMNERIRFVSIPNDEITKLNIGDFIIKPDKEEIKESNFIDKNGENQVVRWLVLPKLTYHDFISKEER